MYLMANGAMLIALLLVVLAAGLACLEAWHGRDRALPWLERTYLGATSLVILSSAVLLRALLGRDFSLTYVAQYTDSTLPLFYTITAFWAGQAGSLLFWALCMAVAGLLFMFSGAYQGLAPRTRTHFWLFFLPLLAFFLLLLTGPNNPFVINASPPPDGQGLNPLLRSIGMILHPPLLFAGYAGFAIPACLALASVMSEERKRWIDVAHNWNIASWVLLTAGILLGGWWAYMELGWGGYWAWDPVENASLIPWFSATALLHTMLVERRLGDLRRTNVFLACLNLLLCLFATYLVRSGVVESLHAFGGGGVGGPLLLAMLAGIGITLAVLGVAPRPGKGGETPGPASRRGAVVLLVWLLSALGSVVLLGTIWPVISQLWQANPVGVNQGFYNTICLPLFTAMAMLLAVAPWLGWTGGVRQPGALLAVAGTWAGIVAVGWWGGVHPLLSAAGVASAAAVTVSCILLALRNPGAARTRWFMGSHGSHLAFAVIVLGVAVSGPFQKSHEAPLSPGEKFSFGGYDFVYVEKRQRETPEMAIDEAVISVSKDGKPMGQLTPQSRVYRNFSHPSSEVSILFSLGEELYATIHDLDGDRVTPLKVNINPMVNWVWIGSLAICLLPFFALRRRGAPQEGSDA
uniref:Cytochrome c assembly protein n=1 Tax=Nitratidesulfovibrio vulgaris (strain DSM 19637 / Miyazaki F) TaxID=883 RepID=B8DL79_NITV9